MFSSGESRGKRSATVGAGAPFLYSMAPPSTPHPKATLIRNQSSFPLSQRSALRLTFSPSGAGAAAPRVAGRRCPQPGLCLGPGGRSGLRGPLRAGGRPLRSRRRSVAERGGRICSSGRFGASGAGGCVGEAAGAPPSLEPGAVLPRSRSRPPPASHTRGKRKHENAEQRSSGPRHGVITPMEHFSIRG